MDQVEIVKELMTRIATISAIVAIPASSVGFGFIEMIKKAGIKTRFIGFIAFFVTFGFSILFCKLFTGQYFNTFNIVLSVLVSLSTSGAYSIGKKAVTK